MTPFHSLRITYSGVASTAALVIALSTGGAYAANLIGTKQIAQGAVTTTKIHKNAVTNAKIKNGAVGAAKLANGSVTGAKLASNSVTSANIVDAAITGFKLADGSVTTGKIADGAITSSQLANGAVGAAKLANNSIGSAKLDAATRADIVPPWGTIPSGKTVVGLAKSSGRSGATAAHIATYLVLPADAPSGIQEVAFGTNTAGADPDPRCAGSAYTPSAPPGLFCIYLQATGYTNADAYPSSFASQARAVSLNMTETAANTSVSYTVAWAYTAP